MFDVVIVGGGSAGSAKEATEASPTVPKDPGAQLANKDPHPPLSGGAAK